MQDVTGVAAYYPASVLGRWVRQCPGRWATIINHTYAYSSHFHGTDIGC